MGKTLRILTNNYNGYRANIVYHPTTGGTRNLGLHVLPYDYISDFIYGEYLINIIKFDKTCVLNYPPPACDFTGSVTIVP